MRIRHVSCLLVATLAAVTTSALAADNSPLIKTLKDEHAEGTDLWIYNDIPKAMAEARRLDRPVFVTFRCVPCESCSGFDAEVAKGSERIAKLAREKFVPVRQVEMKGVDLSLFQFDHDLNWAAMFIGGDGTVYARYGTQSAAGPDAYNSIDGLEKTMQRVLDLHQRRRQIANELKGKRAAQKTYKTALEMPGMENKDKLRGATERRNCIHCHMIHDAENNHAQNTRSFSQDMLWRYPLPENIGLVIDGRDGIRVKSVNEKSPASAAGFKTGEDITHMNGQAIASIADMQWVLHHLPNEDTSVTVRGSKTGEKTVQLAQGWKESDFSWRGSMWSVRPRLRVWMPPLKPDARRKANLADDKLGLEVRWINRGSKGGRSAFESGLRQGDILVAVNGERAQMTNAHLNMYIKLNYKVGEEVPVTVLRGGKEREIRIRLVE